MEDLATGKGIIRLVIGLITGVLVATIGSFSHRAWPPIILIIALLLVVTAGVSIRALWGLIPVMSYAAGIFLTAQVFAQEAGNGSVVMPNDSLSISWVIGASLALIIPFLLPKSWFSHEKSNLVVIETEDDTLKNNDLEQLVK